VIPSARSRLFFCDEKTSSTRRTTCETVSVLKCDLKLEIYDARGVKELAKRDMSVAARNAENWLVVAISVCLQRY